MHFQMVSHKNYHLYTNKGFLIPLASNFCIFFDNSTLGTYIYIYIILFVHVQK